MLLHVNTCNPYAHPCITFYLLTTLHGVSLVVQLSVRLVAHRPQAPQGGEERCNEAAVELLMHLKVMNMAAYISSGKFDTRGTVSMERAAILDYITKGKWAL